MKKPIYKKWWFWTLSGLVFIFIVLPGVTVSIVMATSSSRSQATSVKSPATPVKTTQTTKQMKKNTNKENSGFEYQISQYLKQNFKGTSWYGNIYKVKSYNTNNGDEVEIYTKIYADAEGKKLAKQLAHSFYADFNSDLGEVSSVTIYCKNGGQDDPVYTKYSWN